MTYPEGMPAEAIAMLDEALTYVGVDELRVGRPKDDSPHLWLDTNRIVPGTTHVDEMQTWTVWIVKNQFLEWVDDHWVLYSAPITGIRGWVIEWEGTRC